MDKNKVVNMTIKKSNEEKRLKWYQKIGTFDVIFKDEDERPKTKCWICGRNECWCNGSPYKKRINE
jgi:hypothetical protein